MPLSLANIISFLILCLHPIGIDFRSIRICEPYMPERSLNREFAFTLNDVARLLRTYADHRAAQFGITRAQWAVLARLDRQEGLKQSELAEMLDLQPITLTRLLDRLCDNGLIERRPIRTTGAPSGCILTPAARPLLERLGALGEELMATALAGVDRATVELMLAKLATVEGKPAAGDSSNKAPARDTGTDAMADTVLKFRPTRRSASPARARLARRACCASACGSFCWSSCRCRGARRRARLLSGRRPLHLDRQRLCGRPEGADHARHLRQDRRGRGARRPARRRRRRAVRDRSGAVPARAAARRRASSTACAPISTT